MSRKSKRIRELDETVWPSEPHGMLKHLAYRVYLQCWMAKLLQTFSSATIVDAFAGPGIYADGPLGSPLMTAQTYNRHSLVGKLGRLRIICQEQREDRVQRLLMETQKLPSAHGLSIEVQPPGEFHARIDELLRAARSQNERHPVLWIVDPFDIKSVGMNDLAKCLSGPKDEFILTFLTEEMYRFGEKNPNMAPALDRQFGSSLWREALAVDGEDARKNSFIEIFKRELAQAGADETASFDIRVRNRTPRYSLILATHDIAGIECWNKMKWSIDHVAGKGMHAADQDQYDLFGGESEVPVLVDALRSFHGQEVTWGVLADTATRAGFQEKHLRLALSDLNEQGLAIRTTHLDAKKPTPWPTGCSVRFYEEGDLDIGDPSEL